MFQLVDSSASSPEGLEESGFLVGGRVGVAGVGRLCKGDRSARHQDEQRQDGTPHRMDLPRVFVAKPKIRRDEN
jgi:hypothetical protein